MPFGYGTGASTEHHASARNIESGAITRKGFTTDMAAHVWAQRRQTFGQSGKGVVFFHGRALFDYGHHYCAAWITADDSAVLLNGTHVSPTTSGHVSTAAHAARPRTRVYVPDLTGLLAGRADKSLTPSAAAQCGELDGTREWEAEVDARLANRAYVRKYCEEHAGNLSRDALEFLLAGVGLSKSADKIQRQHAEAVAKEKREADARRKKSAIEELKAFAGAADLPAYLISKRAHFGIQSPEALAGSWVQRIRKARKWAGKASVPASVWRKAWERLQSLESPATLEAIATAQGERERRALLQRRRDAIAAGVLNWRAPIPAHHLPDSDAGELRKLSALHTHLDSRASLAGRLAEALRARYPNAHGATAGKLEAAAECLCNLAQNVRDSDQFKAAQERFKAEAALRERREREERERRNAAKLAAWLAGDSVYVSASRESGAAYLRAAQVERDASGAIVGGRLETSQGAEVPLVEAVRAFRFIKLVRERGQAWHANGARIQVGHFELSWIQADGTMRAGCHLFEWRDVEELARKLGVFELAPDDSAITRRAHA